MTQLEVRKPAFDIDATVPFQWQPHNPVFGVFTDVFTFVAIAFERYVVAGARQAQKQITHPAIAAETQTFLRQEAQHARAHLHHAKALIAQYPGLAETLAEATAAYDELLAGEDLKFHLAYFAALEATFTPLFTMMLNNRRRVVQRRGRTRRHDLPVALRRGDRAPQQRAPALPYCHERQVVSPPRRAAGVPARDQRLQHRVRGFRLHVSTWDTGVPVTAASPGRLFTPDVRAAFLPGRRRKHSARTMLGHVPKRELRTMVWRLMLSQLPGHDPADEPLPAWTAQWHRAYNADPSSVSTYAALGL